MGYYTRHTLTARGYTPDQVDSISLALALKGILNYALVSKPNVSNAELFYDCYDEAKWYDQDEHMNDISRQFPNCMFCVEGIGEDLDDRWRAYYHNGKREYCMAKIIHPKPKTIEWA